MVIEIILSTTIPAFLTLIGTSSYAYFRFRNNKIAKNARLSVRKLRKHKIFFFGDKIKHFHDFLINYSKKDEQILINFFSIRYSLFIKNLNKIIKDPNLKNMTSENIRQNLVNFINYRDNFINLNDIVYYENLSFQFLENYKKYERNYFEFIPKFIDNYVYSTNFCNLQKIAIFLDIYMTYWDLLLVHINRIANNEPIYEKNLETIDILEDSNYKIMTSIINKLIGSAEMDKLLLKINKEGEINYVYQKNKEILQYSTINIINKNIDSIIHQDHIERFKDFMNTNTNDGDMINNRVKIKLVLRNDIVVVFARKIRDDFILISM